MQLKPVVIGMLFAAVLLSCSSTGTPPEQGKSLDELLAEKNFRIVEEKDQLIAFTISSWSYINRENVVLSEVPSRNYLVTLNGPCYNLEFAQRIAFTSFARTLRNTDFIVVTDGPGNVERCYMKTFYILERIEK